MAENQIGRLLTDVWSDLRDPAILWQIGVLALCVLAAFAAARATMRRTLDERGETVKRGAAAYRRIAFPLLAMLFLLAGRALLERWHSANLLSVAIALFGALAGIRFAVYLLRFGFARAAWMEGFERTIVALIWIAFALHLTGILPDLIAWLSDIELRAGKNKLSLWALLSAAFWLCVTVLIALWAGSALEARLMRAQGLDSSLRAVFARLGKSVLLVVAVLVVLPLLGVDLTMLSVFGGALGVGLGLGLQKIASNYVSGFILLLDRSIRLNDVITADNQHGVVTRITTRYVVVRSLAGVEAIIPNDTLVTTTVLNHSYTDKKVAISIALQVAYGTRLEQVIPLLVEIALRHARVLREPAPAAHVTKFADSGIDFALAFWIADPEHGTQNVRSDISLMILAEFRAHGIEIPYPQREVRMVPTPSAPT